MSLNKRLIHDYKLDTNINRYNIKENKIRTIPYNYSNDNLNEKTISNKKEIIRSIIIKKLIELFYSEIKKIKGIKNFGKIFKYNKLADNIQKWCWLQYENKSIQDVVIPYCLNEEYNFNEFIEDFNYTLNTNYDITDIDIKNLIEKIKFFLKEEFNKFTKIKDENLEIKNIRNLDQVKLICIYNNKEYFVKIHYNLYIRLKIKFNNNSTNSIHMDKYIFCLIYRYSYIDAENQQLAIHFKIKEYFKKYGVNFELYGSGINVLSDYYCSLFYDIEKYFGSKGNFFDIKIKSGIYWCNPPYINNLMENTAKKLIDTMNENIDNNIAFIITIPIWDALTQKNNFSQVTRNFNKNKNSELFKDYPIYYLLKSFIKDELIIPKHKIPYFNHRYNKPIYARDTYMLIIYKNNNPFFKKLHKVFDKIIKLNINNYFIKNLF